MQVDFCKIETMKHMCVLKMVKQEYSNTYRSNLQMYIDIYKYILL